MHTKMQRKMAHFFFFYYFFKYLRAYKLYFYENYFVMQSTGS